MGEQSLSTKSLTAAKEIDLAAKAGAVTVARRRRGRFDPWLALVYAFLVVMTIFSLFPIYYVVQASLRSSQTLYTSDLQLFPDHPTLENYRYVLTEIPFLHWVLNSLYVCGLATLLGLFASTTGAYALSRFRFKGRQLTLVALLAIQAFPQLLALLAYYLLMQSLHLINTLEGLALVYAAQTVVFGTWNIKGFYDTLPIELEQAALVDGATPTQAFLRVTLPLALPALASSALFMFINGYNEFALGNILLNSNVDGSNLTFPLGLYGLQQDFRVPWGYFAAVSVLVSVPLMALFLYLQRFFRSGLTIGSVKG